MTAEKIIKALEHIISFNDARIFYIDDENKISEIKLSWVLDLINQLKTENDNYSHNFKQLTSDHMLLQNDYKHTKGLLEKNCFEIAKAKKKLISVCKELEKSRTLNKEIMVTIASVFESSIKEFVEYLIEKMCIGRGNDRCELYVCEDDIKELAIKFLDGEGDETQKETEASE